MKTALGKEKRLWANLYCGIPLEVVQKLGIFPGECLQFFECSDGKIIIEKSR